MRGNFRRILAEGIFVDKNTPATATMSVALGAVAFEFVDVTGLKVKIIFLHELTRKFFVAAKYITPKNFCHLTAKNLQDIIKSS